MTRVCEVCSESAAPLYRIDDVSYMRCGGCGYTFAATPESDTTESLFGDDYFLGGAGGYPDYLTEAALLREHGRRYARILRKYVEPTTLLDVGAAAGYIAAGLAECGWDVTALEPNERMASIARAACGKAVAGSLEAATLDRNFQVVAMLQVIAHFLDVHKALRNAARVTLPQGYWLIETWNARSVTARLLGKAWHELNPPTVLRIFTPAALDRIAGSYGFERVAGGRPQKWLSAGHAKSLIAHKSADGSLMRAAHRVARVLPDALRIPYPAEDLFWVLYQRTT